MRRSIAILSLIIISTLFFTLSAFALTKGERDWKEDILTLLSLVKRVGDYSEVVDLVEVAPALKKDPETRKAFITFAPPGVTPPEWAREEEIAPPVRTEVPEKIPVEVEEKPVPPPVETEIKKEKIPLEITEEEKEEARRIAQEVAAQRKAQEKEEARRITQEIAAQKEIQKREAAPPEIIKEQPKIEVPKEAEIVTEGPPEKIVVAKEVPVKKEELKVEIEEELEVKPTPLPKEAKVIYSTDVVSGVRAEMVGEKMRVTITLSGERKYTTSETTRPPSIIIDIPHTINAVSPETISVNKGCLRMIKAIQHRCLPVDETRIIIVLDKWVEYKVKSKDNEIHIEFEGGE